MWRYFVVIILFSISYSILMPGCEKKKTVQEDFGPFPEPEKDKAGEDFGPFPDLP